MPRTAVIIGATSGLGWKLTEILFRNGWNVAIFGRRLERLNGFRAGVCEKEPARCLICAGDVRIPDDVRRLFVSTIEKYGSIECVTVTAGVYKPHNSSDIYQELKDAFDVNVWGYFNAVNEFAKVIVHSPLQRIPIIGISSTLSKKCIEGSLAYSFSKASLENLVALLTNHGSDRKIDYILYTPEPFRSEMNWNADNDAEIAAENLYSKINGLTKRKRRKEVIL